MFECSLSMCVCVCVNVCVCVCVCVHARVRAVRTCVRAVRTLYLTLVTRLLRTLIGALVYVALLDNKPFNK